jgi:hypothetical protein
MLWAKLAFMPVLMALNIVRLDGRLFYFHFNETKTPESASFRGLLKCDAL